MAFGFNVTLIQPPVDSPLIENGQINERWRNYFSTLTIFLQRINQYGFQVPNLASSDLTNITPELGQLIYNTNLNKLQVWTGATWETITSA